MPDIFEYLPRDRIGDRWVDRLAYSRDASVYRLVPEAVIRPKNEIQVRKLLEYSRRSGVSVTFRTAGTSLSGQSVTNGLIAEVVHDWQQFKVLDNGRAIKLQPGVNGGVANNLLRPFSRKIGPDPASINAARIGGIVSNNSSGMICGTQFNSYHTLQNIRFIMVNGQEYDTSSVGECDRFRLSEPTLSEGLLSIKNTILKNKNLSERIRQKYRIKNTMGYSMNAFLDFDEPLDIFSHLLVGAEGTLAFISSVVLETIPDPPEKATGLIQFDSPEIACEFVPFLSDHGAAAVELMDDQSLRTAVHIDDPPFDSEKIPNDRTGLLIEYQERTEEELESKIAEFDRAIDDYSAVDIPYFTRDMLERDLLWKLRKGLYPTVGALRRSGTTVITEDIAVDVGNFSETVRDLRKMFEYWQFDDAVIFGHAKDGNLHFVASVDLDSKEGVKHFDGMMQQMVELTIGKYNGSLKAEHGTGRNMAPFVETEWGNDIFELMWQIKSLADPGHLLNPGVLLTRDEKLHIKSLKPLPKVHPEVDLCVECGFCERICPSAGHTLTPRQRINIMRELETANRDVKNQIFKDLDYFLDKTCATDGLCAVDCPVNINTGEMVRDLRMHKKDESEIKWIKDHFRSVVSIMRMIIKLGDKAGSLLGHDHLNSLFSRLNEWSDGTIPVWPRTGIRSITDPIQDFPSLEKLDLLLFPTCVGRVLACDRSGVSNSHYIQRIASAANKKIGVLSGYQDQCCGMAFDSHGYRDTGDHFSKALIRNLEHRSNAGSIPIIIDNSPCSNHIKTIVKEKDSPVRIIDTVEFLFDIVKDVQLRPISDSVYAHSVCSIEKMGITGQFYELVRYCSKNVVIPEKPACCGTAGDKGLRYLEFSNYASQKAIQISSKEFPSMGISSSLTCEIGLSQSSKLKFTNLLSLFCRAAGLTP